MTRLRVAIFAAIAALGPACRAPESVLPRWHASGGAALDIVFANDMSAVFQLRSVLFVIDDQAVFIRQEAPGSGSWPTFSAAQESSGGTVHDMKELAVYNGPVPAGAHTIGARLLYQGHGPWPISGYWFNVKSHHNVTAKEGTKLRLTVTGFEKGEPGTPLERRPTLDWREQSD